MAPFPKEELNADIEDKIADFQQYYKRYRLDVIRGTCDHVILCKIDINAINNFQQVQNFSQIKARWMLDEVRDVQISDMYARGEFTTSNTRVLCMMSQAVPVVINFNFEIDLIFIISGKFFVFYFFGYCSWHFARYLRCLISTFFIDFLCLFVYCCFGWFRS